MFLAMAAHVVAMSAPMFREFCELARKRENVEGARDQPCPGVCRLPFCGSGPGLLNG